MQLKELKKSNGGFSTILIIIIVSILIGIILLFGCIAAMQRMKQRGSSDADGTNSSSTNGFAGSTLQEKVWWAIKDCGFSDEQVAGAMGNIDYESAGFTTTAVEGNGEGIGLVQWSYGRKTQLLDYAASKGVEWQDEDTQIEFLIAEMTGTGVASSYATHRTSGSIGDEGVTRTYAQYKESKTVEDATLIFMTYFESPGSKSSLSERVNRANKYYNEFKGKSKPESTTSGTSSDGGNLSKSDQAGIAGYYTSGSGKKYTLYYQNVEGTSWYSTDGCFHCSIATIMSAYGSTKTPNQLTGFSYGSGCYGNRSDFGTIGCQYTNINSSQVKSVLKKGDPIMFNVSGNTLTTDNGSQYFSGHWLTMIDYKNEGGKDKVYIHDPWKGDASYGWADVDVVVGQIAEFIHVYK